MVWLIIAVILIVAIGPIMWLRPSARERRLARLRQRAYQQGMRVELRRLPATDVAAEDRVTAGGRVLDTSRECAAYLWPLPHRLRHVPTFRLLRGGDGTPALPGWSFEPGKRPEQSNPETVLQAIAEPLSALPEDVVALQIESLAVAGHWLEGPETTVDRVDDLARRLGAIGQALIDLDGRLEEESQPGNI